MTGSGRKFDRLKMYFGEPYEVTGNLTVYQPSIGNILEYGEQDFYGELNKFICTSTQYRVQLWDVGYDWNKISDFQLFQSLYRTVDSKFSALLFHDLDVSAMRIVIRHGDDGTDELCLYGAEKDILIDEEIQGDLAEYLRTMFQIFPKKENIVGKGAKLTTIEEDRIYQQKALRDMKEGKGGSGSLLLPLISSCVNHPGFKYKLHELKEVGIVEFMDSVKRLQVYESTVALNNGRYSGFCDMSKVDPELFNFMRDTEVPPSK